MRFIETRGNDGIKPNSVAFSEAILKDLKNNPINRIHVLEISSFKGENVSMVVVPWKKVPSPPPANTLP